MSRERLDEMNRLLGEQDAYIVILREIRKAIESGRRNVLTVIALNVLGDIAFVRSTNAAERVNRIATDVQADLAIEKAAA